MLTSMPNCECANDGSAKGPFDILLVEDEPLVGTLTTEALRQLGHRVVLAATIAQALADVTAGSFDVILLDLQVGGERGEDFVRHFSIENGRLTLLAKVHEMGEDHQRRLVWQRAAESGSTRAP